MKNFEQILSDAGVELTDEQKTTIYKEMGENYKTVADWQKQHDKVQTLETTLKDTQEKLKAFDGVDAEALNGEIAKLKGDLEQRDKDYQAQIADRDFQDMLKEAIASANGRNAKAITALLDVDALKASKNQKEDIAAALKALAEAEDSKMLFGEPEPDVIGGGNPIGTVTKSGSQTGATDAMRSIMGLPPVNTK
ncbi:MAG: phage scaffolding protein [Lachnospiraceae bacterium]|nr:phage scaffolding protein [Lachnospiraceae bacterium]